MWPVGELERERIVYEDDDVLVVDKPAGVASQAAVVQDVDDLPSRVRRYLAKHRGVDPQDVYLGVHQRLDQDTSGLILYALRKEANAQLAKQFEARAIAKTYVAAVSGAPWRQPERVVEHWLAPGRDGRVVVSDGRDPRAKQARCRMRLLRAQDARALIEVTLETGRTHQIRVQLAALGCPIAGDTLYGSEPAFRLMLHASSLRFTHPVRGGVLDLRSEPPLELEDYLVHGVRPAAADARLCERALKIAIERRTPLFRSLAAGETTVFRCVHEIADGFPGLAVDVYDRWLVLRVLGDVPEPEIAAARTALLTLGMAGTYLKRHPKQGNEIVDPRAPSIAPNVPVDGEAAPSPLVVREHGLAYEARLDDGLRTGLFLDQRDNRKRVLELADGKRVLNLFAYTGSFSVAALAGGARDVLTVDVSRAALAWAERNVAENGKAQRHRVFAADAFDALERLRKQGQRFDLVIVDPPSYATTKRGRFRVTKDYQRLCVAALAVLADGGALLACLNHHEVTQAALRRDVHAAARSAGRSAPHLRDLPGQRDFPVEAGGEPLMKSVLVTFEARAGARAEES